MTQISKIYHSREDRIADLHDKNEQINYDDNDPTRIEDVTCAVDDYTSKFCEAMDGYVDVINNVEDDPEEMNYARRTVIERWALAQAALSKAAWVMRFDGNKAYERMINALHTGEAADMRGL
jgi:hypothetical protein